MVPFTRSQTRKLKLVESFSILWNKGLQVISQLSEYVHKGPDILSPQTHHRIDLDEWDLSSISTFTDLEPDSLQYVPPPAKPIVYLKPEDHVTYQQKAMRPPEDIKLLLRKRKIRGTSEKRRRRLFPSTKQLANHLMSSRTVRLMRRLRLPILPTDHTARNLGECLAHLRWEIALKPPPPPPVEDMSFRGVLLPNRTDLTCKKPKRKPRYPPNMILPPHPPLGDALKKERSRLNRRFRSGSFQISTSWRPLRGIPHTELYNRQRGTLDSDPSNRCVNRYAAVKQQESASEESSDTDAWLPAEVIPFADTVLTFERTTRNGLSLANEWEMLAAMQPIKLDWTYQDEEGTIFRDQKRHAGIFGVEDAYLPADTKSSRAFTRLLVLRDEDALEWKEGGFRLMLARLFADVWSQKDMPAYCNFTIECFHVSNSPVSWKTTLDVACIPSSTVLPSASRIVPVIMAAQYCSGDNKGTIEQLASAFHSTLIIMIIYYLDRRLSVDEALPPWMVLYGIMFDESGFRLQEFYPVYTGDNTHSPRHVGWGASSEPVTSSTIGIFSEHNSDRGRLVNVLLRISSRAHHILQKLREWDGYQRLIMSRLLP